MIGKLSNNRYDEIMEKRIDFGKVLVIIYMGKDVLMQNYKVEGEKGEINFIKYLYIIMI